MRCHLKKLFIASEMDAGHKAITSTFMTGEIQFITNLRNFNVKK